jgi:hypothetical protein
MSESPTVHELRDHVRDALDAVAARNLNLPIPSGDWTRQVFVEVKDRLCPLQLECQAFRRAKLAVENGFIDQEFIYDFTAHWYYDDEDHFLIQTAVAGESEWGRGEAKEFWDFHKLLQSDALLCFYVFEPAYESIEVCFERLTAAVKRKQSYRRERALSTSAYLLSCRWDYPERYKFAHRFIDVDSSVLHFGEHPSSV